MFNEGDKLTSNSHGLNIKFINLNELTLKKNQSEYRSQRVQSNYSENYCRGLHVEALLC